MTDREELFNGICLLVLDETQGIDYIFMLDKYETQREVQKLQ